MSEIRRVFATSQSLGNRRAAVEPTSQPQQETKQEELFDCYDIVATADAPLVRFSLYMRDGKMFSYPYTLVSLVESPSGELITLHCNCQQIRKIEIEGRGLRKIAEAFSKGRLRSVHEVTNPRFKTGDVLVSVIRIL
jgi:hypothetical protein